MKRICVFCGSSPGKDPEYAGMASDLGRELAGNGIGLVYGGGSVGMMGILAKAVLDSGGTATGVITRQLMEMEVGYTGLSDLRVVETMHERKAMMADLSDGFIALPGGLGTLEEMFEILTWTQLDIHRKPCGFLNVNHYFTRLIAFVDHVIEQGFAGEACRDLLLIDDSPAGLLDQFRSYRYRPAEKGAWARKMAAAIQ